MKGFKKAVSVLVLAGAGLVGQAHASDLIMASIAEYVDACNQKGGMAYLQEGGQLEYIDRSMVNYMRDIGELNAMTDRRPVVPKDKAELQKIAMVLQSNGTLQCSVGAVSFSAKVDSPPPVIQKKAEIPAKKNYPNESQELPFVGMQFFNFYGGTGTGELINIFENGKVAITMKDEVTFIGDYTNPLQVYSSDAYLFKDNGVYWLSNGEVATDCRGDYEDCFYKFDSPASNTKVLKPIDQNVLDFDFYCSWFSTDDEFIMVGVGDGYDNVVVNYRDQIDRLELQTELEVDENYQLVNDSLLWKSGDHTVRFVFTDKDEGTGILLFYSIQDLEVQEARLFCHD